MGKLQSTSHRNSTVPAKATVNRPNFRSTDQNGITQRPRRSPTARRQRSPHRHRARTLEHHYHRAPPRRYKSKTPSFRCEGIKYRCAIRARIVGTSNCVLETLLRLPNPIHNLLHSRRRRPPRLQYHGSDFPRPGNQDILRTLRCHHRHRRAHQGRNHALRVHS